MSTLHVIELYAGKNAQDEPFVERLQVNVDEQDQCQLVKSPAFIKGLASGDIIKLDKETQQFEIVQHSGNLCVRIYSKKLDAVAEALIADLETLGGELDIETPRMLVFSIHVSCGFEKIEAVLNKHSSADTIWMYGNVYDPQDGVTPLNWWQAILNEK